MLRATTIALVPIALIVLVGFTLHDKEFREAAQEATAGLVTLIPEGLVLLMSVTLAVAAVRLARQNTLVQQMAATEALAAVDTICVDKTGTLTDGTLKLIAVEAADPAGPGGGRARARHLRRLGRASATARWRRSPSASRRTPERPTAEVPFSSQWKWSGLTLNGSSYVIGAPDVLTRAGALEPARGPAARARRAHRRRAPGDRLRRGARRAARPTRRPSRRRGSSRGRWSCSRRRCAPTPPRRSRYMREQQVDLKLISGDARETVTAVAHAVGVPARRRRDRGPASCPTTSGGLAEAALAQHGLLPDHPGAEEGAGRRARRAAAGSRR